MGFGKGDDVAESRAAIATQAVGGTVNRPSGGFNDQQFLAAVASGNAPDLVYLDRQKVGTYAAKGAFLPLTSCIKSQKINMKQYRQAAVNEVTYKGKVYGIPEFYDVRTILVDNNVLDKTKTPICWLNPAKPAKLLAAAKKHGQVRRERQRHPHRLRPEDAGVLPPLGEGVRRRHPLEGRPARRT